MKKLLPFASALILLFCAAPLQAGEKTIQIGGNDFSKLGTPGIPKYNTFFFESFYTAEVLAANGLTQGDIITKVKLPYAIPAEKNFENYDIDMWFGSTTRSTIPQKTDKYRAADVEELQHIVNCSHFTPGGTKTEPAYWECTLSSPIVYDGGNLRFVLTGNCKDSDKLPDNNDYSSAGMAWLFSAATTDYRTAKYQSWATYDTYLDFWLSDNYKFDTYNQYVITLAFVLEDQTGIDKTTAQEAKVYTDAGLLHVEATSAIQLINVYTINGSLCLSATPANASATLDASNLNGIYIVEVRTANSVNRVKVQL